MRLRGRKKLVLIDQLIDYENTFHLELIDQRALPEERFGESEVTHVVEHEVRSLPPLLRNVLIMRDIDQMPIKDIADVLGVSVAAAKSRLTRARVELKARMGKHLGTNGFGTLLKKTLRSSAAYTRVG
jgi:RNA polymerase sigma-70 factor (ECF subfamily)